MVTVFRTALTPMLSGSRTETEASIISGTGITINTALNMVTDTDREMEQATAV